MNIPRILACIVLAACIVQCPSLLAHALGEDYAFLRVEQQSLEGNLQLHERELRDGFGLIIEHGELPEPAQLARIRGYVEERFAIEVEGQALPLNFGAVEVLEVPQGRFLQMAFAAPWPGRLPRELTIRQELFFELDPRHRGLVLLQYNAVTGARYDWEYTALVFSPQRPVQDLNLEAPPGLSGRGEFLWQGAWHILIGYDHILFLLTLLLTAVLVRSGRTWQPEARFRQSLWNVAGIVSVFTLAHSVTLTLAALGWIAIPSRLVESVIALSILVMALNNLRPFLPNRWLVIFIFGLFHGLGFANVLDHITFRMVDLVSVMVLFNIGVELGQLSIVAVVFRFFTQLESKTGIYHWYCKQDEVAIALVASFWLVQRITA